MAKKRYTPEIIIRKLREAEVLQGQGQTNAGVFKDLPGSWSARRNAIQIDASLNI